jgi:hypothetical protein
MSTQSFNYKSRLQGQLIAWANGNPQHNHVDDECCPDFSCCFSDFFEEDRNKRLARMREILEGK